MEDVSDQFERARPRLRSLAYRVLGSEPEAEDAVQEAWFRLDRTHGIENLDGWLTTVVGRICLDMLRSRNTRREEPLRAHPVAVSDPEHEVIRTDDLGRAMLVVLDTLGPAERVAYVLHDMFEVPFGDIGTILDRSPDAAKMLASRARRRLAAAESTVDINAVDNNLARQREVVVAFLAASRAGDFGALLELLDPEVIMRADAAGVAIGTKEAVGAHGVAQVFNGSQGARLATVGGRAGAVWAPGGRPKVAFLFTLASGRIAAIDAFADAATIEDLRVMLEPRRTG